MCPRRLIRVAQLIRTVGRGPTSPYGLLTKDDSSLSVRQSADRIAKDPIVTVQFPPSPLNEISVTLGHALLLSCRFRPLPPESAGKKIDEWSAKHRFTLTIFYNELSSYLLYMVISASSLTPTHGGAYDPIAWDFGCGQGCNKRRRS